MQLRPLGQLTSLPLAGFKGEAAMGEGWEGEGRKVGTQLPIG